MNPKPIRPRAARAFAGGDVQQTVPSRRQVSDESDALRDIARHFLSENDVANKAKASAEKAKAQLFAAMVAAGVKSLQMPDFAKEIELVFATINEVDVNKLAELVSKEKFMQIITATQTAVTAKAGKDVLVECLVARTSTEQSLKVKKL